MVLVLLISRRKIDRKKLCNAICARNTQVDDEKKRGIVAERRDLIVVYFLILKILHFIELKKLFL
jgi:hypothetical protein